MNNINLKKISKEKVKKNISYLLVILFLSFGLSFSFQSLLAFDSSPLQNPPAGNFFRKQALVNEGSSIQKAFLNIRLGVLANFLVGTNSFFVSYGNRFVSVGSTNPATSLDVNGLMRVGNYTTVGRPMCNAGLLGSIYFDVTVDRAFVCTNSGWSSF